MISRRYIGALSIALCFANVVGVVAFWGANAFFVNQAERNIESLLLSQRGMHHYIQRVIHPSLYQLKDEGVIAKDFYSPKLFSSSYIVREQHRLYNENRRALGLEPIYYKMAATNPRNPVNRADEREAETVEWFNQHREVKKLREVIELDGRRYLSVTMPFLENNTACLRCHGLRENAPSQLQAMYPGDGGFNERMGRIRAVESIRVPIETERRWAWSVVATLLGGIGAFGGVVSMNRILVRKVGERTKHLAQEITERQRAEDALRVTQSAVDMMSDAVFRVDQDGTILYANQAAIQRLGYSHEELLGGMKVGDINARQNSGMWRETWKDLSRLGSVRFEADHRCKDGRIVPVEMIASYMRFGDKEYGWGIARDLTERRRLERQILLSQKMEALGTLAGGIAHDFNNILAAITGYARLVHDSLGQDDPNRDDVSQILRASDRARDLVRQILVLSRRSPRTQTPLQIGLIVKEALKLMRASLPKTIDIRERIDLDAWAIADPTGMHQIVMNLCTNASAAMPDGTGILEVTLAADSSDSVEAPKTLTTGSYVRLRVKDSGVGIDPEHLQRIFEPFFTTRHSSGGTGLGLAVVHGLVTGYGGAIVADSIVGKGATFDVWLPRVDGAIAESAEAPHSSPSGSERILLIDDEVDVRHVTARILGKLGYRVCIAADATEALALLEQDFDAFDLILSDQTMPTMTGLNLASAVRQARPAQRFLLMTGYNYAIQGRTPVDLGVDGLLYKPFSNQELAQAVRAALDAERTKA